MFTLTVQKFYKSVAICLSLLCFSSFSNAENMKMLDQLEVHYIGLSTSILQPEIAKQYNIERSRYRGFVNISILDTSKEGKPAITAGLSGSATNLVGQRMQLEFEQIKEGSAIYYIAIVKYPNDETYNFDITINNNGKEHKLKFQQKFYIEQ
ncbi:DUF4426 domain-containing protein [Thalassomonas sp. M1454]|uniref:DUF4426 domain-containing protein n=1 Tax=Thalassomonas sp. M1454 TaxID=2594477 RepID=UPI00117CE1D1|nr:DUF4426 domain-containing protein [Thalassomonas sp. M1454]TRX55840.1 DUF4426 domain-containing protein [Thalassomonas sp. M1454]